jgi:putative ABC transport system ATP-binding protein
MLIEVLGLSKTYRTGSGEVHALRDVDLGVARGESLAIMGSSGSGKSSLLNILGTLDKPSAGKYALDSQVVSSLSASELARFRNRKIGFVFQQFNLLPRYTALANVELPLLYAGVDASLRRQRAMTALRRVGLDARMHHLPSELSGGQQQRVAIARALVQDPVLLLADEPTGALDTATTAQIMDLFCGLHREGMTLVMVTHEPEVAAYMQRVIRFQDGRIISDERNGAPGDG